MTAGRCRQGGFFNTGQVCAALTRVLVPPARRGEIASVLEYKSINVPEDAGRAYLT